MSNSGSPLPLKTLRLKPLREEEMMSTVWGLPPVEFKNSSGGGLHHLMEENQTEPPRGGHHEKERKGEAGFAGASDRGTGFEHNLELCRAGQPQPRGAANRAN